MVLWLLVVGAVLVALVSLGLARRLDRKLDALTQSYWELRYDYTRLRSQVARLDPAEPADPAPAAPPAPTPSMSFVPLASIRKKDA